MSSEFERRGRQSAETTHSHFLSRNRCAFFANSRHRRLGKPRQQPRQECPERHEVFPHVDAAVDCLAKHVHTKVQVVTSPGLFLHGE